MKQKLSTLIALALVSGSALAQSAAPATPEPASTLAYNVGVVSEYRYRGITQSHFKPALQGGVDYSDKSGFYAGAWASTIRWISDNQTADGQGADGPLEVDLYGGYKWSMGDVVMWDNTGTMHRVTPFDVESGRYLHRVTLKGKEPVAA